jgi:hypothetical protein
MSTVSARLTTEILDIVISRVTTIKLLCGLY